MEEEWIHGWRSDVKIKAGVRGLIWEQPTGICITYYLATEDGPQEHQWV